MRLVASSISSAVLGMRLPASPSPVLAWLASSLLASSLLAWPQPAAAHAGERGFVLTMPTEVYASGAAAAVLVSFLALALTSAAGLARMFERRLVWRRPRLAAFGVAPADVAQAAAFPIFALLVWVGLTGPRDPAVNLLPLTVWTLWWVGFTLLVACVGDLWRIVNPWSGPARLLRWALGAESAGPLLALPERLGCWPAILGFLAFAWFEIVSLAPSDPTGLAEAVLVYWAANFAAVLVFGEAAWLGRGEAFSVFFARIGRLAPIWSEPDPARPEAMRTVLALPGARLVAPDAAEPAPDVSTGLFMLLALAAVSFDGLVETFWWLALVGENPLEFTGRSAVVVENTAGLLAAWAALVAAVGGAIWFGRRLAGGSAGVAPPGEVFARLAVATTPIALGYHFGHYLASTLVQGQYALVALSDPLGRGDDWLGLGQFYVTTSFFYDPGRVAVLWGAQASGVAVGHLVSVLLSHAVAAGLLGSGRAAFVAQAPLALFMALYTLFGLWLLSTPIGA